MWLGSVIFGSVWLVIEREILIFLIFLIMQKKKKILMPIYKKILIIFTTPKLDATVKNRFQIFILHPKKQTIKEK